MIYFAWIIASVSFFTAGWFARGLWDLVQCIDESELGDKY